jgi:crotonobetainyl-CoA:carnitine CoA-transferase CaiB-like acyl-CoA transferase
MQAAAGIMSVTGEPGGAPVRVGASVVDLGTAVWAALAIVAALYERAQTGRGRLVDVSLYETALAYVCYQLADVIATGREPMRLGTAFPLIAPYEVFATADGELMVAAANDRLFSALCAALGLPELSADPRFATNPRRVFHRGELRDLLAPAFASRPTESCLRELESAGIPATPVRSIAEVAHHEQTRALEILQELDGRSTLALPMSADGERLVHRSRPPRLGEHSAELLAEAGFSEDDIRRLVAAGVVRADFRHEPSG